MRAKRGVLFAVIAGSAIVFLESSVVAVALPQIGESLSSGLFATLEAQSYVYYAYLLALSALLVPAGALNDHYGRKKMFAIGLGGFGATSILCAAAWDMDSLIAARLLQGASAAVLVPGSLSIITSTFEGEEQARAFGTWAGASAIMTIIGPVVGGALVAYVSWRAAFWINLPLIGFALWATLTYVPETRDEDASERIDWTGAAVILLATGGLAFGAIRGQAQQWGDPVAFASLAIGAAAAVAFPITLMRSSRPLVPPKLFRSRNFLVTNVSTLLIYGSLYVVVQYLALYLVGVLGYNEIGAGLAGLPSVIFLAAFSTRVGAVAEHRGPRVFMAVGPALIGIGVLWLARIPAHSTPWRVRLGDATTWAPPASYVADVFPGMALFGLGLMIMVAPLTTALMRSVPVRHAGVASAFNNAVSRVGPQLAGAVLFMAVTATFYARLEAVAPTIDTSSPRVRASVSPLNPPGRGFERFVADVEAASAEGFRVAMYGAAALSLVGAAVNAIGIRNSPTEQPGRTGPPLRKGR